MVLFSVVMRGNPPCPPSVGWPSLGRVYPSIHPVHVRVSSAWCFSRGRQRCHLPIQVKEMEGTIAQHLRQSEGHALQWRSSWGALSVNDGRDGGRKMSGARPFENQCVKAGELVSAVEH